MDFLHFRYDMYNILLSLFNYYFKPCTFNKISIGLSLQTSYCYSEHMQIQCQIARRIIEDTTKKTIIESSLHVFIRFESVSRLQLFELQLNLLLSFGPICFLILNI